MSATETDEQVRAILQRENVTEPGGEWSVYDVAVQLDPEAHKPASMFDTAGTPARMEYVAIARESIERIAPSGRYVGGMSRYLYHL